MGGAPSVVLTPESDSLAVPGTKVVLSEDLSDVTDYDTLVDGILEFQRDPVDLGMLMLESSRELEERGKDHFHLKIWLDRTKIGPLGESLTEDPKSHWYTIHLDRATGKMTSKMYVITGTPTPPAESEDKPLMIWHTYFHKSPLLVETYVDVPLPDGTLYRAADQGVVDGTIKTLGGVVEQIKAETRVKVRRGESRKDPSKAAAMSGPLDALTSLGTIVDNMFLEVCDVAKKLGAEVTSETSEEFVYDAKPMHMGPMTGTYSLDRGSKSISMVFRKDDGAVLWKTLMVFHQDPLQLEAWGEVKGERAVCVPFIRNVSIWLNHALARGESWFG